MPRAFSLPKCFGIGIRIDGTFLLLLMIVAVYYGHSYGWEVGLRALVFLIAVFACVLAHELSHSLAAACFGIRVSVITLSLVGGVASMDRIPREPKKEFLITLAGPLFNILLATACFFPLCRLLGTRTLFSPTLGTWPGTVANIFWANPVLAVFNLIPAFPMDGGRLLRSLLTGWIGYTRATQISIFLGRIFAILFALLGIWKHLWMLTMIAVFLFVSASREKRQIDGDTSSKVGQKRDRPQA